MRIYILLSILIILIIIFYTLVSKSAEKIVGVSANNHGLYNQSADVDVSNELWTDRLNLSLLATVSSNGSPSKAIIKDHSSGELKSYYEGEAISAINSQAVTLIQIGDCGVIIENGDLYQTLWCINNKFENPLMPFLISYKIAHPGGINENGIYGFKSDYEDIISKKSRSYGIDPDLIKALIYVESNFNPIAVSYKHAAGIMQLIPDTAKEYGVDNPFDVDQNIDGGVRVLRDLINYFNGDIELALAAYNAGKGAVIKHGYSIPPYAETINYVHKVLDYYSILKSSS